MMKIDFSHPLNCKTLLFHYPSDWNKNCSFSFDVYKKRPRESPIKVLFWGKLTNLNLAIAN